MRLADVDTLLERTAELEAVALKQVNKYDPSDNPIELAIWMSVLAERTAFKEMLMDAPTVDAEPIRHGHWKPYTTEQGRTIGVYCSECRNFLLMNPGLYCPSCGAKMDERER